MRLVTRAGSVTEPSTQMPQKMGLEARDGGYVCAHMHIMEEGVPWQDWEAMWSQ